MIFPTVTETTPRPEAVTPDPFLGNRTAREVAVVTDVRPLKARLLGGYEARSRT